MRLVFFGLSLSSSWGNGHATTYRSLLRGLAERGHEIRFFERDQPWYADNRDLSQPEFCSLVFYSSLDELRQWRREVAQADAVIIGSYVPEALRVIDWLDANRGGLLCFYDIDTPVTLRKLADGDEEYLSASAIPLFDVYLSFTGGPVLRRLEQQYGARCARALYCSVDAAAYRPVAAERLWDFGYLGTYSPDRQDTLQRLLMDAAVRLPDRRFVVAGSQFPGDIAWPANVERIEHLPPTMHAEFYSSLGWTLNVTRRDMILAGYSPSVRLFEATACGAPVISDQWAGLEEVFAPGSELLIANTTDDVVAALSAAESHRTAIAAAGRRRTLMRHTSERRAAELEEFLRAAAKVPTPAV